MSEPDDRAFPPAPPQARARPLPLCAGLFGASGRTGRAKLPSRPTRFPEVDSDAWIRL